MEGSAWILERLSALCLINNVFYKYQPSSRLLLVHVICLEIHRYINITSLSKGKQHSKLRVGKPQLILRVEVGPLPAWINKVLLKHSHTHLFPYWFWLLSPTEMSSLTETTCLQSVKYLLPYFQKSLLIPVLNHYACCWWSEISYFSVSGFASLETVRRLTHFCPLSEGNCQPS